ncbi:MAG TPA: TetR/AcrR family transcriptional regulator [Pseudonocardiaceae bacterium]|jgi:AcrR family transcriptional regulator|nr:TetR/AcrR family transcriptional regulator [Pseudonocardiaceae bacterium]
MGNREDLLAGALECLKTKGWTRTTVRDIAAAAGVNHAAIGYHFGSREALLIEAFTQAMEEWGEQSATAMAAVPADAGPHERYEAFWRAVIGSYDEHRWLWLATVEAAIQAEHSPPLRELVAGAMQEGRTGLAAGLLGVPEDSLDARQRAVGSVQLALMSGVLVQRLIDPDRAPRAEDIVTGIAGLAGLSGLSG